MKILVVSILRLGDLFMCTPIISGLKKKYPGCEIHLLANAQFKNVFPMLPDLDKVIPFDRDILQAGLGDGEKSLFEPYDRLDDLVSSLSASSYDLIVNLTHNRLSGWLCGLISAKEKLGLTLQSDGSGRFGNKWFELLNNLGSRPTEDSFHFVDIFAFGVGLRQGPRSIKVLETEDGITEAARLTAGMSPYIVVQALTSDQKKNWGEQDFIQFMRSLSQVKSAHAFVLVGSPNEKADLDLMSEALHALRIRHRVAICSIAGALSLMKSSELVVTGDTSIMHLATAADVPVLELSLGSSSYQRTGAYTDKAVIIQAKESCAPCNHNSNCPYAIHKCAKRITPECVALVAQAVLEKNEQDLRTVASEFSDQVEILRTQMSFEGEWKAISLNERFDLAAIKRWIERSSHRLYLNEIKDELVTYGSEGVQLDRLFSTAFPDRQKVQWLDLYKDIESKCEGFRQDLETLLTELKIVIRKFDDEDAFDRLKERLANLIAVRQKDSVFRTYLVTLQDALTESLENESKFYAVKRLREIITDLLRQNEIETKLVKSLRNQVLEKV